jgi:hypothetical protein
MAATNLLDVIIDPDARSTNFFNGRLLSGEDLQNEQAYSREQRRMLGQALGEGVAYGLEVSLNRDPNTVRIKAGLALNRTGLPLRLKNELALKVTERQRPPTFEARAAFGACDPISVGAVAINAVGTYVLVIGPAQGRSGRARVSGLGGNPDCSTAFISDAVYFDLRPVPAITGLPTNPELLRNALAYECFGTFDDLVMFNDPFGASDPEYGLVDQMRAAQRLTNCEVPLALIHFASGSIAFVDMWSVRRRVTPLSLTGGWTPLVGERFTSEAEARFLQFQAQIEEIRVSFNTSDLAKLHIGEMFRYLPPAGLLPLAQTGTFRGFDIRRFFSQQVTRLTDTFNGDYVEAPMVRRILTDSMAYPPIDLSTKEVIWIYNVHQASMPNRTPLPYVIFASAHMPYYGEPRYNANTFNFSRYDQGQP